MSKTNRRNFMGKSAVAAAGAGVAASTPASAQGTAPQKRVIYAEREEADKTPRFSGVVAYGNLLFLSGVGYHKEGDIKVHTEGVLEQIKKQLEAAGSFYGQGAEGFRVSGRPERLRCDE